jgi:prophage maintenance system killer protein
MMHPLTLAECREQLFPYIRSRLSTQEPAPNYEQEQHGLDRLESILTLMDRDEYPDTLAKAAYLFCAVIDGHPFSNGNKRLGVTVLLYFLLRNGFLVNITDLQIMRQELQRIFPNLEWENVASFHFPHEFFFYHLALIIADRKQKGQMTFPQEQAAVRQLLEVVMLYPV